MPVRGKFETHTPELNRRHFIRLSAFVALGLLSPSQGLGAIRAGLKSKRSLSFYNTHTGESLKTVYWAEGEYVTGALEKINRILRDHRTGEIESIDTQLLDLLNAIRLRLDTYKPFHIISGYRSPKTNARLRKQSCGVARNSLHMLGKAVDIRVPGFRLPGLRKAAMDLKCGGVGYYPRSSFIHVDVGRVRYW